MAPSAFLSWFRFVAIASKAQEAVVCMKVLGLYEADTCHVMAAAVCSAEGRLLQLAAVPA